MGKWPVRVPGTWGLAGIAALGALFSAGFAPSPARAAAVQDWPPLVLVAGLLLIGLVAHQDRLFSAAGEWLAGVTRSGLGLYAGTVVLVSVVTALLNLDTSVAFLTPVLVYAARSRGKGGGPVAVRMPALVERRVAVAAGFQPDQYDCGRPPASFRRALRGPDGVAEVVWLPVLVGLFGVAVAALVALLVSDLPAASLLGARTPPHPFALLVGLNLGPNLFVTGSLAWILWLRTAQEVGARPSIRHASRLGATAVPLAMMAALGALSLTHFS